MPDAKPMSEERFEFLLRCSHIGSIGVRDFALEVRRLQGREEKLVESLRWALKHARVWGYDKNGTFCMMCDGAKVGKRETHKPTCLYHKAQEVLEG